MLGTHRTMEHRRYYGLDALRGSLMMLGIVLHAAMFYVADPPLPLPTDHNTSPVFDVVLFFIHSFRMQAFFVLAGFFAALLVARRGVQATLVDRAKRILAPMVVAAVTILPVVGLFAVNFALSVRFGTHDLFPDLAALKILAQEIVARGMPVDQPSLGHLWFLEYLCILYLLLPFCRWLVEKSLSFEASIHRFLKSPFVILIFGLGTATISWPYLGGQLLMENTLLMPHWPSLLYFGSFFVLGYMLHYYTDFLATLERGVFGWAALALLLIPLAGTATLQDIKNHGQDVHLHLAAVLANGLFTWTLIFLFIGCAMRFFDRDTPWIQYASQSAYWVYLVHMVPVAIAAWWLIQYDLHAILKFCIICGFTLVVSLVSFHYCVQKTWISDFLHGRRFDLRWPWQKGATPT
jgi:glucans biosynthesis protein C